MGVFMVIDTVSRFKKKYTLALLLWAAGSVLAFMTKATLSEYTMFAGTVLTIFGIADVSEKKVLK